MYLLSSVGLSVAGNRLISTVRRVERLQKQMHNGFAKLYTLECRIVEFLEKPILFVCTKDQRTKVGSLSSEMHEKS